MNILSYIYNFFIGSLEYVFDFVFTIAYYITDSAGLSIIALSLFVNIIMIPIRNKADEMSKQEKDKQASLKPWVDKIKKAFKGDEQYMILQTYYRQNNYKPIYSLRSSISLLIQIPFFIAAYNYISNSFVIYDTGFMFIDNLSAPDKLLFGYNLLPILMTIISVSSNLIYTKGSSFRDNIQLYVLSLVFLVILYNASSGLVMYYLLNNLFSLVKGIYSKTAKSNKILKIGSFFIGVIGLAVIIIHPLETLTKELVVIFACVCLMLPMLIKKKIELTIAFTFDIKLLFISETLLIVILSLFIPTNVISSSPTDFVGSTLTENPNNYIYSTFFITLGLIGFWFNICLFLLDKKVRSIFNIVLPIICFIAIVNYLFFGTNMGNLSKTLEYQNDVSFAKIELIINLMVDLIIAAICLLFIFKKKDILRRISIISLVVLISISFVNIGNTYKIINDSYERIHAGKNENSDVKIKLSSEKENVIIIVLDRAISYFFPYIINEDKKISNAFSDFTYYPNTLSFAYCTVLASPALYGGYDYTMYEIDKRGDKKLVDEHNEALMTMPVLFADNGFDVTVFDQQFANYETVPDMSIYDDYPTIDAYNVEGKYTVDDFEYKDLDSRKIDKLLLSYSITKSVPLFLFNYLYNYGIYNSINNYFDKYDSLNIYFSRYLNSRFYDAYAVLEKLPELVQEDDNNCLCIFHCMETHESQLLQLPNYEMSYNVNNSKYIDYNIKTDINGNVMELRAGKQLNDYCSNLSSLKQLVNFFDYLKNNNMYDNSRIIVVADHGYQMGVSDDLIIEDALGDRDITYLNPLLLVKDFGVHNDFVVTDNSFMTNADVPTLATKDIIDNPLNPFTGLPINSEKKNDEQIVTFSGYKNADKDIYKRTIDQWYSVKDNIFEINNWSIYDE